MKTFESPDLPIKLCNALEDLGITSPTPIQTAAYSVIRSGKDVVGIAQTGTGKTFAYLLPILKDLEFSKQIHPRVLILVPTRELVIQLVEQVKSLNKYTSIRVLGVYGGTNISTQSQSVARGTDILVGTPGRLYDLVMNGSLRLKAVKKLVVDEVDVMLDLGFRYQLKNIFDLLPDRRQNLMFSATMTDEVDALIDDFFLNPSKISIAVSGTPLDNIAQLSYPVPNFLSKVRLLIHLLKQKEEFSKALVFVSNKKNADRLFGALEEDFGTEICVIHSNKSQNYRIRSVQQFDSGANRVLVTTDVMARGLDLDKISHVINFDTPAYPENYMHRIGRTGRAEEQGKTILFYTKKEETAKAAIEALMKYRIPILEIPSGVTLTSELIPEERTENPEIRLKPDSDIKSKGGAFHEKKEKNTKTNQGGSYLRKMKKYKKPKTRGDKNFNKKRKR